MHGRSRLFYKVVTAGKTDHNNPDPDHLKAGACDTAGVKKDNLSGNRDDGKE
jgi:hypothetical protein